MSVGWGSSCQNGFVRRDDLQSVKTRRLVGWGRPAHCLGDWKFANSIRLFGGSRIYQPIRWVQSHLTALAVMNMSFKFKRVGTEVVLILSRSGRDGQVLQYLNAINVKNIELWASEKPHQIPKEYISKNWEIKISQKKIDQIYNKSMRSLRWDSNFRVMGISWNFQKP